MSNIKKSQGLCEVDWYDWFTFSFQIIHTLCLITTIKVIWNLTNKTGWILFPSTFEEAQHETVTGSSSGHVKEGSILVNFVTAIWEKSIIEAYYYHEIPLQSFRFMDCR